MKRETSTPPPSSDVPSFEGLEEYIRAEVQRLVQRLLDQEATEVLGRQKYERAEPADSPEERPPYRNGHGEPRRLTLPIGTIEVRRPRLRNLSEVFESRLLPLFQRRSQVVNSTLPELYLHGLALRDFDMALRGLLGDEAPLSPSSIARLKAEWREQYDAWRKEPISERPVYLWADGVYVKAGLEKDKAAVLVVIAAFADGTKRVLAAEPGFRESRDAWKEVLGGLAKRGLQPPRVLVADGGLGLWAAVAELGWPCLEQRCWKHKTQNVLDVLPNSEQKTALKILRSIPQSKTREEAEARRLHRELPRALLARVRATRLRLGAHGGLLPAAARSLEAPAYEQRRRVALPGRPPEDQRGPALQEDRERHRHPLEALDGGREHLRRLERVHLLADLLKGTKYVNGIAIRTEAA